MYHVTISGEPKFFAMIPKMARQDLSPGAYKLYGLFKDIAGEQGACWAGQSHLLELLGEYRGRPISVNSLRAWRDELAQARYIRVLEVRDPDIGGFYYRVIVNNLWDENRARFDAEFRALWLSAQSPEWRDSWLYDYWRKCRDLSPGELVDLRRMKAITEEEFSQFSGHAGEGDQKMIPPGSKNDPQGDQKMIPKKNQEGKREESTLSASGKRSTDEVDSYTGLSIPVAALDRSSRDGEKIVIETPKGERALPGQEEWTEFEKWLLATARKKELTEQQRGYFHVKGYYVPAEKVDAVDSPTVNEAWEWKSYRHFVAEIILPEMKVKNMVNITGFNKWLNSPSTWKRYFAWKDEHGSEYGEYSEPEEPRKVWGDVWVRPKEPWEDD